MRGIICMWSGSIATIPEGWHLCDGTENTPDLRNKFIVGAGDEFNPDDTDNTNIETDALLEYYALAFIMKL